MEPSSSGRPKRSLPKQRGSAEFPHNERVRCPCRDDGGGEIVRFFARLDLGTAFATLIRQRHPMPSCGGLAPTAERTVDPARMIEESLTSDPGIREHPIPELENNFGVQCSERTAQQRTIEMPARINA